MNISFDLSQVFSLTLKVFNLNREISFKTIIQFCL